MAKICNVCDKKIGFMSTKYDMKDGAICSSCILPFGVDAAKLKLADLSKAIQSATSLSVVDFKTAIGGDSMKHDEIRNVLLKGTVDDVQSSQIEGLIYEFDGGVGDILFVFEDRVTIRHKGVLNFFAMGMKGDKTIYLSDITSVQLKEAGFTAGYIQFSLPGGNQGAGGVFDAAQDEDTITFGADKNDSAKEIANYLNEALRKIKTASKGTVAAVSASDEIRKFKALLDEGIISQEEFDSKKKQLLGM